MKTNGRESLCSYDNSQSNQEFKLTRCSEWVNEQHDIKNDYDEIKDETPKIIENNTIKNDTAKRKRRPTTDPRPKKKCTIQEVELTLECEWKKCHFITEDYSKFQLHVKHHMPELALRKNEENKEVYVCLWDVCYFETDCSDTIVKHVNFHAYHTKLKAVGFNLRELNDLPRCTHDSVNRNIIPDSLTFSCGWGDCVDEFTSAQEFYDHIKCHVLASQSTNKKDTNFYCGWRGCKVKRARCVHLSEHCRAHSGEKVVACVHCGTMFSNNTKLADHCLRQIPIELCAKKNFLCRNCSKFFPSNRLLRDHMRLHINNYKCSLCDMTCTTPSALAKHIRYRHVDDRVFKCYLCDHACVTKRDLRLHMNTHDDIKKYACDFEDCDFRCRSLPGLTKHTLTHQRARLTSSNDENQSEVDPDSDIEENAQFAYCCHVYKCKQRFIRGSELTKHLIKKHGFHWPPGHSRFTYRVESDGYYRLQTMRYENIELSENTLNTAFNNELLKSANHDYDVKIEVPTTMSDVTNIIVQTSDNIKPTISNKKRNAKKGTETRKRYRTKNNCDPPLKTETDWLVENESNQTDSNLGSIEDFSVMKRYISDKKPIIITLDDVDEKGNVIKSQVFHNED